MRQSQPLKRASTAKKEITRIQRRHKVNVNVRRKMLPGEVEHVEDMVVILALAGYSRTQSAQVVGISRGQVREILERPHVTEKLVLLRQKLPAAALELLHGYMIEAVITIAEVMRTSKDDKYTLMAAAEILDRGGVSKVTRQERKTTEETQLTVTDDGIVERLRQASPEIQEQAAALVENLEELLTQHATAKEKKADDAPAD